MTEQDFEKLIELIARSLGEDDYPRYFDPEGNRLTMVQWAELLDRRNLPDTAWWKIDETHVGDYHVSTVWVGLDMNMSFRPDGVPLIFETMVFGGTDEDDDEIPHSCWRWPTKEAALRGHAEVVRQLQKGTLDPQ